MSLLSVLFCVSQLTQQEQLDILGGLDAVLLEVLLYLLAPGAAGPLLGGHGAAHDDGLEGAGQVQPVTTPLLRSAPVRPCHSGEQYPCPATSLLRLRRTGCCCGAATGQDGRPPLRRSAEQPEAARWTRLDTWGFTLDTTGHWTLFTGRRMTLCPRSHRC